MKNNMMSRIILCILLLGFLYVSAACSVDGEKKSKKVLDVEKKAIEKNSDDTIAYARKKAFVNEAEVFIHEADNKNYELREKGKEEASCYNISDLFKNNKNYIGYVKRNSDDSWTIYVTNNTYTINGKKSPLDTSMVQSGNKLSKTTC